MFLQHYNTSEYGPIMIWTLGNMHESQQGTQDYCCKLFSTSNVSPGKKNKEVISLLPCSPQLSSSQQALQHSISECCASQSAGIAQQLWSSIKFTHILHFLGFGVGFVVVAVFLFGLVWVLISETSQNAWMHCVERSRVQSERQSSHLPALFSRRKSTGLIWHIDVHLKEETMGIPNAYLRVHKPSVMHPLAKPSTFAALYSGWKKTVSSH